VTQLAWLLMFGLLTVPVGMAQQPQPATPNAQMVAEWQSMAKKVNGLAAAFPEEKYDYQPTKDVRTFAQTMLHIAFWNDFAAQYARGQKPDGKANEYPRERYRSKAEVVEVVKKSFDNVLRALEEQDDAATVKAMRLWTAFQTHNGEHYGQLVVYYRLNGLVPPKSRK
jgi:hypothetical protein